MAWHAGGQPVLTAGSPRRYRTSTVEYVPPARETPVSRSRCAIKQALDAIMQSMRQLIARVDDDLHARLRERAAHEGRSVNTLVNEILAAAVAGGDRRTALRMRARATGRLVLPPRP